MIIALSLTFFFRAGSKADAAIVILGDSEFSVNTTSGYAVLEEYRETSLFI